MKPSYILFLLLIIYLLSCKKEFSCEGNCLVHPEEDINHQDTAWRFTANGVLYYGFAEYALFNPDRNGFYWGGPSKMQPMDSLGMGLRIDPLYFNTDYQNLKVNNFGFVYRIDSIDGNHYTLFHSFENGINGTLKNFNLSEKIAETEFSGEVINELTSDTVIITDGRFKLRFQ